MVDETKKDSTSPMVKNSDLDKEFARRIMEAGGKKILACFQCGTCSSSCPAGRRVPIRTRQLMRKALAGFKDEILSDDYLWACTTCYTCYERCPRDARPTEVIKAIRNLAVQEGYLKESHRKVAAYALKTGHAVPITEQFADLREKLGLERLPPNASSHKEAVEEILKIARKTGFTELVGFKE